MVIVGLAVSLLWVASVYPPSEPRDTSDNLYLEGNISSNNTSRYHFTGVVRQYGLDASTQRIHDINIVLLTAEHEVIKREKIGSFQTDSFLPKNISMHTDRKPTYALIKVRKIESESKVTISGLKFKKGPPRVYDETPSEYLLK